MVDVPSSNPLQVQVGPPSVIVDLKKDRIFSLLLILHDVVVVKMNCPKNFYTLDN